MQIKNNNLGQNIWRLSHFLAQFLFTISETELDYDHQKVNVRDASRHSRRWAGVHAHTRKRKKVLGS